MHSYSEVSEVSGSSNTNRPSLIYFAPSNISHNTVGEMAGLLVTVGGYVAIAGAGALLYYASTKKAGKRAPLSSAELRKEQKRKIRELAAQNSAEKDAKSEKEKPKKKPKQKAPEPEPAWLSNTAEVDSREEIDNRAFARQLSSVKAGTTLKSTATVSGRQKSVKQSRAQEKPAVESSDNTAPSSNAGGDADDDQSPINSPQLNATDSHSPVLGGVSDMLEAPAAGPSVLRVTSPTNPAPAKKQKTTAPVVPAETKKQRQNRKKNEEQSAAKLEAEKERKRLEEKQRRSAREAEGRAAKDGSSFLATKAPATSVWTPGSSTNGTPKAAVDLLDTYEPAPKKPVTASNTESEQTDEWQNLPSEEEQYKRAMEESSDNWQTVSTQKKKKKTKAAPGEENQTQQEKSSSEGEKPYEKPKKIAPTGPGQTWKVDRVQHIEGKEVHSTSRVQDSEWEV